MSKISFGTWAVAFDQEGYLWFSDFNYGGLYKYDLEDRNIYLEHFFENGTLIGEALHSGMVIRDNKIYLVPLNDSAIRIYDIKTKKESKIILPNTKKKYIVKNDDFWIISEEKSYKFDYTSEILIEDEFLTDLIRKIKGDEDLKIGINVSDTIVIWNSNKIYNINYEMKKYEEISIEGIYDSISNIFFIKQKYWILLENSHNIIVRNANTDSYETYKSNNQEFVDGKDSIPYSGIYNFGEKLVLLNYYGKHFMEIDELSKTVKILSDLNVEFEINDYINYGACYYRLLNYNGFYYFIPQRSKYILKSDANLKLMEKYEFETDLDENCMNKILYYEVLKEGKYDISLNNYLEYLKGSCRSGL